MTVKDIFDRPAPLRRLMICTGPCCNTNGLAKRILDELQTKLLHAMARADLVAEAACVRRSCLGKCTGEPLAYVHPEGVWYHHLSAENLMLILRDHVLNERPVQSLVLEEDP